ncbi:hypothetical protein FA15DRAFT_596687, partial [Coprinopsis marcescibilis]
MAPTAINGPTSTPDLIAQCVALNPQQNLAYRIITDHFIHKFILKDSEAQPLHMLMTGPGGTGKTYVVNTAKEVMCTYQCGHRIRFLAPTGSAAALIDGMTIHKGLGLRINSMQRKGQNKQTPGIDSEDISAIASIKNLESLRAEWKDVDIVFIDKVSLLSAQLLCEIDYAL